jgi:hypothetical protein
VAGIELIASRKSTAPRFPAVAAAFLLFAMVPADAAPAIADLDAPAALRDRFSALKDEPGQDRFHRPLYMDSSEGADAVKGEILALVDHPFATVGPALGDASRWCDILILHPNTKYCRASAGSGKPVLHVIIGKKYDQPVGDGYGVDFAFRVAAMSATYLQVKLDAADGPLGTHDYRIDLEAVPSEDGRTILRLSYAYSFGLAGRLAMQAYLGTTGRNKVGFAVIGRLADGGPQYITGIRSVVERNTMRYYLAVEAFLGALSVPPAARAEKSFLDWYAASERFARQLHEMEQGEYMAMKRREYARQNSKALSGMDPGTGRGG